MSIIGSNVLAGASGSGVEAYQIEQSLRFDGNGYLSRSPGSNGNLRTNTISVWIKQSAKDAPQSLFGQGRCGPRWSVSSNVGQILHNAGVGGTNNFLYSNGRYRDPSAWYHLVIIHDTTQATESDRVRIYINGTEITFSSASYPGQNADMNFNNTEVLTIGRGNTTDTEVWLGYMAEYQFIDGSAVEPDQFAEADNNGVWRPIEYTGSYGTQGYYLKFDSSATNGIGHDHSGNGNNFTATNFTTSGTGTDVMSDTPTTNWCTLNPLTFGPSNADMVEGNLRFNQPTATTGNAKGTIAVSSGKWYWEVTPQTTAVANVAGGILGADETSIASQPGNYATGYSYGSTGETRNNGVDATYGDSYGAGDVIGTALDLDAGTLVFYKNGVSQGTAYSGISGTFVPAIGDTSTGSNSALVCNFGQRAFEYTPPTGFKALNTSNLPAPTVKDGSEYFNTVLYTGNATARSITGVGFQPDWIWIKRRSVSEWHLLSDSVRGVNAQLATNTTNQEQSRTDQITSFDTDGFSLGTDGAGYSNANTSTYVAWNWLAGGTGSSNTDGSITSTVSANPTAGFSIVSYTGNGQANATVGHGLGVAPRLIIVKDRDAGRDWAVQHGSLGATKGLYLNLTNAASTSSGFWSDTAPTSTVFTVGTAAYTNYGNLSSGDDFIAYCFAEVEGYSKFGSYTGTGGQQFVYLGFAPEFVMLKRVDSSNDVHSWYMFDSTRDPINNNAAEPLMANKTFAEGTLPNGGSGAAGNVDFDFLSNGFGFPSYQGVGFNGSGATIIYAAFAKNPFGGSGVSPATAR